MKTKSPTIEARTDSTELKKRELERRAGAKGFGSMLRTFKNGVTKGFSTKKTDVKTPGYTVQIPRSDAHNLIFPLQRHTGKFSMKGFSETRTQKRVSFHQAAKLIEKLNRINESTLGRLEQTKMIMFIILGILAVIFLIGAIAFFSSGNAAGGAVFLLLVVLSIGGFYFANQYFEKEILKRFKTAAKGYEIAIIDANAQLKKKEVEWVMGEMGYWVSLRLNFMYKVQPPKAAAGFSTIRPDGQFPPNLPADGKMFNSMAPPKRHGSRNKKMENGRRDGNRGQKRGNGGDKRGRRKL